MGGGQVILPLWFYLTLSALAALLVLVVAIIAAQRRPGRAAADHLKETPPAGWSRRTFKPICKPADHDWYIPGDGRTGYCLACGEPMDYQPHSDRLRLTGTEVKPADPRRRQTLWEG